MLGHTNVLMSIRQPFAAKIAKGEKRIEYRKKAKGIKDAFEALSANGKELWVYVYISGTRTGMSGNRERETASFKFRVTGVTCMQADMLWKETKEIGGISEEKFFEYAGGSQALVYGIRIGEVERFAVPIELRWLGASRPPQSWQWVR
jgi:predicted transcriptional regulator